MAETFRLTLAQLNPTLGALEANAALARQAWEQGKAAGADMVALTEMFITGYQTRDLVMKPAFFQDAMAASTRWRRTSPTARRWASAARGPTAMTSTTPITSCRAARFRRAS